jgi:hypothetical protein
MLLGGSMNREEAKEYLKMQEPTFLKKDGRGKGYVCPICGSGSGAHGTGISRKPGMRTFVCWANHCTDKMDIFELYGAFSGKTNFKDQFDDLCAYYGISVDAWEQSENKPHITPFPLTEEDLICLGLTDAVKCPEYMRESYEKPRDENGSVMAYEWVPDFISVPDDELTSEQKKLRSEGNDNYFLALKNVQYVTLKSMYLSDPEGCIYMISGKMFDVLDMILNDCMHAIWRGKPEKEQLMLFERFSYNLQMMFRLKRKLSQYHNEYLEAVSLILQVLRCYLNDARADSKRIMNLLSAYAAIVRASVANVWKQYDEPMIDLKAYFKHLIGAVDLAAYLNHIPDVNEYTYSIYALKYVAEAVINSSQDLHTTVRNALSELYLTADRMSRKLDGKPEDEIALFQKEVANFRIIFEDYRLEYNISIPVAA